LIKGKRGSKREGVKERVKVMRWGGRREGEGDRIIVD
jgi:hypothetical protein